MADIAFAVLNGVLTLLTAYLGVHITMHPAETDRSKKIYKAAFCICGIAICFLSGLQAYRNVQTSKSLEAQIGRIESNTKTPPTVQNTINVPSLPPVINIPGQMTYMSIEGLGIVPSEYKIGGVWAINAICKNDSASVVAENASCIHGIDVVETTLNSIKQPIVSVAEQEKAWKKFRKALPSIKGFRKTYGPGETSIGTVSSSLIDAAADEDFRNARKTILFHAEQSWKDGAGTHIADMCTWLQIYPGMFTAPGMMASNPVVTFNDCENHNGLASHR